jgi:hypothetical protein
MSPLLLLALLGGAATVVVLSQQKGGATAGGTAASNNWQNAVIQKLDGWLELHMLNAKKVLTSGEAYAAAYLYHRVGDDQRSNAAQRAALECHHDGLAGRFDAAFQDAHTRFQTQNPQGVNPALIPDPAINDDELIEDPTPLSFPSLLDGSTPVLPNGSLDIPSKGAATAESQRQAADSHARALASASRNAWRNAQKKKP